MQNIKLNYIPVGQVIKINKKTSKVKNILKGNKMFLIISLFFLVLISIYAILFVNFINLLKLY